MLCPSKARDSWSNLVLMLSLLLLPSRRGHGARVQAPLSLEHFHYFFFDCCLPKPAKPAKHIGLKESYTSILARQFFMPKYNRVQKKKKTLGDKQRNGYLIRYPTHHIYNFFTS